MLCKFSIDSFRIVNFKVTLFTMSPKENEKTLFKKMIYFHKYVVPLVLLAMMLIYYRFKIHIAVEYSIENNLIPKEIILNKR